MGNFNGKFDSAKQDWETPQQLFDAVNDIFDFTIDLAASESNKKVDCFIGESSLGDTWRGVGWLNPPYGGTSENSLKAWVKKAYLTTQSSDAIVVMLIPARTNTNWWHQYCMLAKEIWFINGRPKFGSAKHGLPQPLAIIVFALHHGDTIYKSFALP